MSINKLRLAGAVLSILFALSTGAVAQATDLAGKQWRLTTLNGSTIKETKAFIVFDLATNRVSGDAGCNRMFGSVNVGRRNIAFSRIGTTKMMCTSGETMKVESEFIAALAKATGYRLHDDELTIYQGNHGTIRFVLSNDPIINKPAVSEKLEDKKWVLEWIGEKPAGALGSQAFISFFPDRGSAGGNTSCNVYGGNYSVKGKFLSIKQVISTMRACVEDDRMQIERFFLDGLERTDRYEIRGGKLYLYHGASLLLTFRGEEKNR